MALKFVMPGSHMMARAVAAAERGVSKAQKRALRKAAQWTGRQSARQLARAHRVPLRAINGRRPGRAGRMRWTIQEEAANVWVGTAPVKASRLGSMRQQKRGARAGQHTFPGGFLATMRSGHTGVFRRAAPGEVTSYQKQSRGWTKGRPRTSPRNLPLIEEAVDLDDADSVRAAIGGQIPARYRELLRQETNFEQLKWERQFGGVR